VINTNKLFKVEELPRLASGKSDFKGAKKLAMVLMGGGEK